MSTFSQQYQHFQQPLFVDPHTFAFGHYDTGREKTPTDSLINHTGHSPIPLTTTPPLSHNPSRPPELPRDQPPDHMFWDNGSLSDSPTSVRTPDGESFEIEMLDSDVRSFYHQNGVDMSTQVSHNAIPAIDQSMFLTPQGTISDHALQAALNASIQAQQYQQQHYDRQMPQAHNMHTAQPQHNAYIPNYTTQPPRQEPWNGQGPSRSSMTPRTGGVIFDPVTDPVNYGDYLHDVENWTMNYTDPNYLVSPSEQMGPPQENFFNMAHNLVHRPQIQIPQANISMIPSPVEMQLTKPSPPPDQRGFVNYDTSSSLFTDSYIIGGRQSPSSPGNSSTGQYPRSPFQPTASPSMGSPSSDGMSFFQQSDAGMMIDSFPIQQFNQTQPIQTATLQINYASSKNARENAFATTTEPEFASSNAAKNQGKTNGGRQIGTHLQPETAKAAHDMRKISACWHCVLQRDKCGPGDICERCLKRSQRPNADCGLGCIRIKLTELLQYFLPATILQMHEDSHLKHFVSQFIHQWGNVELTVYMTCGGSSMPRIPVKVYEFVPRGNELLVQIQYVTDPHTNKRIAVKKQSPALGMVHINHNEEKTYDKYITQIVDHHLDAFGELCWMEDDNDFQQKLFKLMTRVKPKNDDESKLLHEVFRLIVATFIMSHTLTIAEEGKHTTLQRMHSYGGPTAYADNFTSPRMTNRQLKYFFARLQKQIQTTVLNKLQQIFKSSKGCDKWLAAFVAVLGMCMALEDQQKTIHLVMSTKSATEGLDQRDAQGQADELCREIDSRMLFVQQIFRWKYNRKHNPLLNADHDWEKEAGFGDRSSVEFVRQVAQLVKENTDYLRQQQRVSISCANQTKYTARLVGEFLLSFWLPNA
ncbi:hypothetical protein EK21DRAFT_57779 [Setomelanomma holmii]|uniref:Uncharacterized protein n=1 Tax=Setomelanomma holmii TaxID=210430 RepID=A0A9P4HEW6_9PLEO|nr:hypothetical protein EK21DRAFT_57779 [Setomelanomma holmii]